MSAMNEYMRAVQTQIARMAETQRSAIRKAAITIVDTHLAGHRVFVFGPGLHSFMGVEEFFYRSGGLAFVRPIAEPELTILNGARGATQFERTPGRAKAILESYDLKAGDVLIINNAYGINACSIDAALYCREHSIVSIAITSSEHSRALPPDHPARHPSKGNLFELVDIHIDTFVPVGDGVVTVGDGDDRIQVGPCSTIGMAVAVNCIVCEVVGILRERGADLEVWKSGNAPGGDAFNQRHFQRYGETIRHL